MMRSSLRSLLCGAMLAVTATAFAGGAWVLEPGESELGLGFSRKTASSSWNIYGDAYTNASSTTHKISYHDFRYFYLSGEQGLFKGVSATYLITYLNGYEGAHGAMEKNDGPSDAWLGLKFRIMGGDMPAAISLTYRTPYLYDLPGPYTRYLYDSQGKIRTPSPEWRGLLKQDLALTYLISKSFYDGKGWMNGSVGYNWREGAPADQIQVGAEYAHPLGFIDGAVKGTMYWQKSRGNDSLKQPDDRFGKSATNNFNQATYGRAGIGVLYPFGFDGKKDWWAEAGYNQWLWGKSARRYREPYVSIGRRF